MAGSMIALQTIIDSHESRIQSIEEGQLAISAEVAKLGTCVDQMHETVKGLPDLMQSTIRPLQTQMAVISETAIELKRKEDVRAEDARKRGEKWNYVKTTVVGLIATGLGAIAKTVFDTYVK